MAYDGVHYVKSQHGPGPEAMEFTVGAVAVKAGDFVKIGASAHLVIPITATTDVIVGLANGAAGTGEKVFIIPATSGMIYRAHCASTKKFVSGTDDYTTCDWTVFTSGAMALDPATASTNSILLLGLYGDSPDDTAENEVLFMIIPAYRRFD